MVTEGAIEPGAAALAELGAHARIDGAAGDAALVGALRTACALCEAWTGRVLLEREMRERVRASGAWTRLGRTPVRAVTAVSGAEAYAADIDAAGDGWLRLTGVAAGVVEVSYRAGLATDWGALPEPLRGGVLRMAAHLYASGSEAVTPPAAVAALWRPYRRMPFGRAQDRRLR